MSEKNSLECTITTEGKTEVYKDLASVVIPSSSGSMQILPGHAEAFVMIDGGEVVLKGANDKEEKVLVAASQCHIQDDKIVIIS